MPLLGGRAYPAFGERGAFTIGTRRDVYRRIADMTPSGETAADLGVNARGRIVNLDKSAAARARYMGPQGARLRARNDCAAAMCGTDAQLAAYGDVSYQPIGRQRASAARLAALQARSGMVGFGYDDVVGGRKGRGRAKARRFFRDFGRGFKQGLGIAARTAPTIVPMFI